MNRIIGDANLKLNPFGSSASSSSSSAPKHNNNQNDDEQEEIPEFEETLFVDNIPVLYAETHNTTGAREKVHHFLVAQFPGQRDTEFHFKKGDDTVRITSQWSFNASDIKDIVKSAELSEHEITALEVAMISKTNTNSSTSYPTTTFTLQIKEKCQCVEASIVHISDPTRPTNDQVSHYAYIKATAYDNSIIKSEPSAKASSSGQKIKLGVDRG